MKIVFKIIILIAVSLYSNSVLLKDKIITLETEGTAMIGEGITISDAKTFAINYAKQTALEQVGTYLESNITIINQVVEKDEIKTFTGSVLKIEVLNEVKCMIDNNFAFRVTIRAMIDTDLLNKRIEDVRNDKQLEQMIQAERKRVEELTKQVSELKKRDNLTKEKAKTITKGFEAVDWFQKGREACFEKKFEVALEYYKTAIELDPKYAAAYGNRGKSYYNLKEYDRAVLDFNKVIELDPKDAIAYNNRANAYADLKDFNRAIHDYNKAIELDPKYADIYYNRGNTYKNMKEYNRAIQDYNKAIQLDPKYTSAYGNRGLAFFDLQDYNRAIQDYNKAIQLDPKYSVAYNNRGTAFIDLQDYNRAINDYNKAIELDPKYAAAYFNRGLAYYNSNNYGKSAFDLNEFLRLAGNYYGNAEAIRQTIRDMGYEPKY